MKNLTQHSVILFDGVCNLCNSTIQFIIKKDTKHRFKFASLQSDAAREILLQYSMKNVELKSIVFITNNRIYLKSSAVLRILWELGGFYKLLNFFLLVPKPLRDLSYDYIAKNRYRWFGKKDQCIIPTPELKNRFLN